MHIKAEYSLRSAILISDNKLVTITYYGFQFWENPTISKTPREKKVQKDQNANNYLIH